MFCTAGLEDSQGMLKEDKAFLVASQKLALPSLDSLNEAWMITLETIVVQASLKLVMLLPQPP